MASARSALSTRAPCLVPRSSCAGCLPSAGWGSLPVEGGIEAAYRADLEASDDPAALLAEIRARLDAVRSPFRTAERFGVEEIIDPRETRALLCDWVKDAYAILPSQPGRPSFGTRP